MGGSVQVGTKCTKEASTKGGGNQDLGSHHWM